MDQTINFVLVKVGVIKEYEQNVVVHMYVCPELGLDDAFFRSYAFILHSVLMPYVCELYGAAWSIHLPWSGRRDSFDVFMDLIALYGIGGLAKIGIVPWWEGSPFEY